jgi:hypothetical protein
VENLEFGFPTSARRFVKDQLSVNKGHPACLPRTNVLSSNRFSQAA